jgi:iron complex outermembrane receptor protein
MLHFGNAGLRSRRASAYSSPNQPHYRLKTATYSLYGNWGRTFQVGLGMEPSINEGWEIGLKLKPADWAEGRVAYWRQDASNEMSRNLTSSDTIYLGATTRQGVDIEVKVTPTDQLSIWSAYSLQEAKITTAGTYNANVNSAAYYTYEVGNQVVNTPNYLFSAGIDYQITPALRSSLWTSGQGDYFVDQANALSKYGDYALLNLDLGYQVNKQVEVQFQAKNLTNTHREYVWYHATFGSTHTPLYSPGDGIAFYGAVNVKYDF